MKKIDLGGLWSLTRVKDGTERPMLVPGDIISALLAAGEISDPYREDNELGLQWIGREDWIISRAFTLDQETASMDDFTLDVASVDTIATIRLNGFAVASSRNMFRRIRVELGSRPGEESGSGCGDSPAGLRANSLRAGRNIIEILIQSPERAAAEAAALLPYPMPYSEYPVFSPHRNLVRKEQCMAGWDWGPCLMTGGIYDSISIIAHSGPRIEYIRPRYRRSGDVWTVDLAVDLHSGRNSLSRIVATLAAPEGGTIARVERKLDLSAGNSCVELSLKVDSPSLWWPAGHGAQALYPLGLRIEEYGRESSGFESSIRIGFRDMKVVAEEDSIGKSMYISVNGRGIFAKGANWIPADSLPSRRTRRRLESLLDSAIAANMNCLRVWGGGRYESDDFYELCDEKGILVWQDCMFSCALYPSSTGFLAEVDAEIRHQVGRIQHHPSIALWCGNNEALGAITWYEASRKNPSRYIVDYDRLYEGVLGKAVRELDPDRTWWPSSPSAGPGDFSDNWHVDGRGDMHYWSVWHEGKPFSAYLDVRPRFCSEFGFQSFPSARTVANFAEAGDFNVTSPVLEHHQRHPRGNSLILDTMTRYYRMPSGFEETLYLSQVQQAMAIRTAVEWWRSLMPECMGTLYWQLNDVWPVASWSSLEYDGSWKLLHYEARRFYAPIHLALLEKNGEICAIGMNDTALGSFGTLAVRLLDFSGGCIREWITDAEIPAGASTCLWSAAPAEIPGDPRDSFFFAEFLPHGEPAEKDRNGLVSWIFRTVPKRCRLPIPTISVRVESVGPEEASVRLSTTACAFHVQAVAREPRGFFSDAGFILLPGRECKLSFRSEEPNLDAEALAGAIDVWHLASRYR